MNRTIVAVVAILAAACLIGLYIWTSQNRYYIMTGDRGVAYEVDRKTGQSWMIFGEDKIPHQQETKSLHNEQKLTAPASLLVTGNARLLNGSFRGKIYNGSDWTITRVVIKITAKEADGATRWSRNFSHSLTILPLSAEYFSFNVTGDEGVKDAPWVIDQVFGYKE